MPQCVAQQDTTIWLSTMTQCVWRQCTRHFGIICTHHQWLIQLSCLSTGFSPDVVREYLPYCSRSVLAKAQLFHWIHTITGRTWLVDVGDTMELQALSPASLIEGYATVAVTSKAPTCLRAFATTSSMEPFQHVMASCGFTSTTQHTGNAARPWEYREALRSIIALDSETVGYDVTQHSITYGDYFDKHCFCKVFNTDLNAEPCSEQGLALTRERMWTNATCGPTSLPGNWTDGLKTTTFAYIPTEDWRWPSCVDDMPKRVIGLADRWTTDACEPDSDGYCNIKRAVDRTSFCHNINYESCKGSCHDFEGRIDYVNWLHSLCGSVDGWYGLPKHWRQLAGPITADMIPWRWSIKPVERMNIPSDRNSKPLVTAKVCASTDWKLTSLVLINIATLLFHFLGPRTGEVRKEKSYSRVWDPESWFSRGLIIIALHLLANGINATLVQSATGYEDVPYIRLVLLWCSMPRLSWFTILLVGMQPFTATSFASVASCMFAETVLQTLSTFHMMATVDYGREHSFYNNDMARLENSYSAQVMYAGALMWLVVVIVALVLLLTSRPIPGNHPSVTRVYVKPARSQASAPTIPNVREDLITPFNERWTWLETKLMSHWIEKSWDLEEELLLSREQQAYTTYGTLPVKSTCNQPMIRRMVRLYLIAVISMFLLWVAQWLFWVGFIGLSLEEYVHPRPRTTRSSANRRRYCPPHFGVLTVIWIASSLVATKVAMIS